MKKNIFFLFSFILLQSINFQAQKSERTISWDDFEIESRYDPKIITFDVNNDGDFVILKKEPIKGPGGWQYFLEIRNNDMEKIDVIEISSLIDSDRYLIDRILLMNNNIVVFSSKFDKPRNEESFYFQKIDINSLEVSDREEYHSLVYEKRRRFPNLIFKKSLNNKNILITATGGNRDNIIELFLLLDEDLKTVWSKDRSDIDFQEAEGGVISIIPGNFEDVYVLVDSKDRSYQLLHINKKGEKVTKISKDDYWDTGVLLVATLDNRLFITGYYTNKETRGIKGTFLWEIDANSLEKKNSFTSAFSDELLNYSERPKSILKKKKKAERKDIEFGVYDLSMDNLIIDGKGDIYLIGSQYYVVTSTYTDANGNTRTKYTYYYEDIYVTKFDKNFKHIYNAKVPKKTVLRKPGELSTWFLSKNGLSFVFIDNKKNLSSNYMISEGTARQGKYDDNVLGISTISADGTTTRESLFDYYSEGNKKFVLHAAMSSGNDVIFLGYFGKKHFKIGMLK